MCEKSFLKTFSHGGACENYFAMFFSQGKTCETILFSHEKTCEIDKKFSYLSLSFHMVSPFFTCYSWCEKDPPISHVFHIVFSHDHVKNTCEKYVKNMWYFPHISHMFHMYFTYYCLVVYVIQKIMVIAIRTTYYIFCCTNKVWDVPDLMTF